MTNRSRGVFVLVALASAAVSAGAQDPRAMPRLDAPSKAAITAIVDSARAQGVPVEPLMEKVYEGLGKGAEPSSIVIAVRNLSNEMANARHVMGTVASADELKAAASALHAGVPAVELGKMKKQGGLLRSLVTPFTVLTDMVTRGVPVGTAVNAVRSLVGAGAKDKDINEFQRNVQGDIQQGAAPGAAAETRAKGASSNSKPDAKPEQKDQEDR